MQPDEKNDLPKEDNAEFENSDVNSTPTAESTEYKDLSSLELEQTQEVSEPAATEEVINSETPSVEDSSAQVIVPDAGTSISPDSPTETPAPSASPLSEPAPPTDPLSTAGPAAVTAAAVAGTQSKSGGKKKKLGLAAGIVIAIFILLAGGAGAYFGIVLPNQPQKIVQDALVNTTNTEKFKTSQFEGEVNFSGGEVSKVLSGVTFQGGSNAEAKSFDLKISLNTAVTKIGLDARTTDGKEFYIRVSGLEGLDKLLAAYGGGSSSIEAAMMAQYAPIINKINNQWYSIDQSLLSQIPGADTSVATQELNSEDTKKLGAIYKEHQFLNIDKKLADQDIHGVASYHVQATVNKEKLKGFLEAVKAANIKSMPLEQKDIDDVTKADFSKYPFEMWVSKKNRLITQLAISVEDKGTTYKMRVALKDINKPVTVEKPADAKSILELIGELTPSLSGGSSSDTTPSLLGL